MLDFALKDVIRKKGPELVRPLVARERAIRLTNPLDDPDVAAASV